MLSGSHELITSSSEGLNSYVESLVPNVASQYDGGRIGARYDMQMSRADLYWDARGFRVPVDLLGSGVQQLIALVGHVLMTDASLVAIEEPECNLRYELQLRLAEAFQRIAEDERGPTQLFLTSHSPAFDRPGPFFYWMFTSDGAPRIEKRPVEESRSATGLDTEVPPAGRGAPLSYVTNEGIVRLPPEVVAALHVERGGGVVFTPRDQVVELRSNEQYYELIGEEDGRAGGQ